MPGVLMRSVRRGGRAVAGLILAWAGWAVVAAPGIAPAAVLAGLLTATVPLGIAWRASRGTALRASVAWAGLALGLGVVAQALALGEAPAGGRPAAGHWAYVCTLTALAASISVLNAR